MFDLNLQGQQLVFNGELEEGKIFGYFTQKVQTFSFELTLGTAKETVDEEDLIEVMVGTMKAKSLKAKGHFRPC